jgi:hypothetical protein
MIEEAAEGGDAEIRVERAQSTSVIRKTYKGVGQIHVIHSMIDCNGLTVRLSAPSICCHCTSS